MISLLAGLMVPVGAIVQMIFQPPGGHFMSPAATAVRLIVTAAATISVVIIATRFRARQRRQGLGINVRGTVP